MLQAIKKEVLVFVEEPALQNIVSTTLIALAAVKCVEMSVTHDITAGLHAIASLVAGVLILLCSFIKKDATHLHKLRLNVLSVALILYLAINFIASDMYFVHKFFA